MRIMQLLLGGFMVASAIFIPAIAADQQTTGDKNNQNVPRGAKPPRPTVGISPHPIPGGLTTGSCTSGQATTNRTILMAQTAAFSLPENATLKLDTAFPFKDGMTIGCGTASVLRNGFDTATQTVNVRGGQLGYVDYLTVTGPNQVTLADRDAALNYKVGQPAYFFRVDGFEEMGLNSQLRTLHGIAHSDATNGNIKLLGPTLDSRLTGGKWFYNATSVGDVKAGTTQLPVPASRFHRDDMMLLTEGTTIANEGRDEWLSILKFNGPNAVFKTPVKRNYSAAVLAQALPVKDVTLVNFTLSPPTSGMTNSTAQINYATNWQLTSMILQNDWYMAGCSDHVYKSCTIGSVSMNSCHDMTFIDCTIGAVGLEEGSFNINFKNCTFTTSINCNTNCHWLTFTDCTFNGTGTGFILDAPGSIISGLTGGTGTGDMYLTGDNWTIVNVSMPGTMFLNSGYNYYVSNVAAAHINLGLNNGISATGGRVSQCPNATFYTGQWRMLP